MNRGMRFIAILTALGAVLAYNALTGVSEAGPRGRFAYHDHAGRTPPLSGAADPRVMFATKGVKGTATVRPRAAVDDDDIQANGDNKADPTAQFGSGAGLPANETSIAVNPIDPNNVIGGTNDYEPGVDSIMGIYASFDGGHTWPYSRHARQIITPSRKMLGSGDPVIAFDTQGVAYAAFIAFGRDDCDSYIAVIRSYDKGVTWTVPVDAVPDGSGYLLGDGIVVHNDGPADCQFFHDKEWMAAGPRPGGATLVEGTDPDHLSPDRVYVTWTLFDFDTDGLGFVDAPIFLAYSDDEGRHWSTPTEISGSSPLCNAQFGDDDPSSCDEDQFSVPVVAPDGSLYVAFENSNRPCCKRNQLMVVRSDDGGSTFEGPFRITQVWDGPAMFPICGGRQTLDDMCARTPGTFGFDVDPINESLHVAWFDNRNGTAADTNGDVFYRRSVDGGTTWRRQQNLTHESDDDQFFPWLAVADNGTIAVTYYDRRYSHPLIDTNLEQRAVGRPNFRGGRISDVSWNPDLAFRLGVFIGDYNGVDTTPTTVIPFWTDARFAEPPEAGNNPQNPQSDAMVDVEPLAGPAG